MPKWYAYWGSLCAVLFGIAFWRNRRKYRSRSAWYLVLKAAFDTALVAGLAAFFPPLLIAFCVLWLTRRIYNEPVWRAASVLAGISLSVLGGVCFEALLVVGVFAADLVSGRFLHHRSTADQIAA